VAAINRHRRLANYQYIGLHDRNELRDGNEYLACIRHLHLFLHDRQMCEQAGNVLACMRNLTRLDVEGHESTSNDTGLAICQLIIRTFGVEHELPRLRSLRLKGLHLSSEDDEMLPLLPGLRDLEHLQLILCYGYIDLLLVLRSLSLKLKSFTVCENGRRGGGEFYSDGVEFVRSMDSLQHLSLVLDTIDDSLLDWSALHAQASGIKSLKMHCTSQHRLFALDEDASDFRRFCTKASGLQQLSISGITLRPSVSRYDGSDFEIESGSLTHLLVCLRLSQLSGITMTNRYTGLLAHGTCFKGSQARCVLFCFRAFTSNG
jgi:hypothetical protein